MPPRSRRLLRAEALLAASAVHYRSGTLDAGFERAEEAFDVAVAIADQRAEWHALQRLSEFAVAWDDGEAARRRLEQGLVIARREGLPGNEAVGVYSLGVAHWILGNSEQAEELLAESIVLLAALAGTPGTDPVAPESLRAPLGRLPRLPGPAPDLRGDPPAVRRRLRRRRRSATCWPTGRRSPGCEAS